MRVHLINPSRLSFGFSVITPRWLYVMASATPGDLGEPRLIDETLERADLREVGPGDVVGISVHTGNAARGYELGRLVRSRGAFAVFGGIHATLFPGEAAEHGGAHAVVKGDGERVWAEVLADCAAGVPRPIYEGGKTPGAEVLPGRWSLLPPNRYMWASVQTVRGCPKYCSFCSVWRTDGREPRQRKPADVLREVLELRRRGFRFIALADDNFYPVSLADLDAAARSGDARRIEQLEALRTERFELMSLLARLPSDTVFYTQITMEAAEDAAFLDSMRRAHIRGALVGVESVTPEGLKSVAKSFNLAGDALVGRLRSFQESGVHVLGSFILGLPGDRQETFQATARLADEAGLAFAQFLMLTPFPGTTDFARWAKTVDKGWSPAAGPQPSRF